MIPLLADYVSHQSRGTCAAFLVLMSSLGALASAYLNFTVLNEAHDAEKIFLQYGVASTIALLLGLTYTIVCLKPGNEYYSSVRSSKKTFR